MIAACPKCSARYRVDAARLGPEGAKLRCTKCSALFLVRVPNAPAPRAVVVAPGPAPVKTPTPDATDSSCLVLVADSDAARGKVSVDAIRSFGISAQLVHDGVEAMLGVQRLLPRVVVLEAALPHMDGFQICEIVKRNTSLNSITVVLVGAVHDQSRHRPDPSDLYGADHYLEHPDLPDGLEPLLRGSGLLPDRPPQEQRTVGPVSARVTPTPFIASAPAPVSTPAPEPARTPARTPVAAPVASAPAIPAADTARDEERERARRLARIAVSEMLLYQPEKFSQACRDGTLERALDGEIQEARALLRQRIGPEVRAEADFVLEELHRVARERGARG
jgi:predicted Zn finger-like uncharacterized protein